MKEIEMFRNKYMYLCGKIIKEQLKMYKKQKGIGGREEK